MIRESNGTPLQYSCLENPMDRGAWWAAVHGVTKSWTLLSDFTSTFHFHALEKEMATHSSVLAWRIPGMGEPDGLPSMGSHRVRHDWSDLAAAAAAYRVNLRFLPLIEIWPPIRNMSSNPQVNRGQPSLLAFLLFSNKCSMPSISLASAPVDREGWLCSAILYKGPEHLQCWYSWGGGVL